MRDESANLLPGAGLMARALRDIGVVVALAIASLGVGIALNRVSSHPLPLLYQTPGQRFGAELTSLLTSPPLKLAPAPMIDLAAFRKVIGDRQALILDARPAGYFVRGHVPGARNLSRDNFARDYQRLLPVLRNEMDRPVIVYCSGGDCHDSRLVANALLTLGFSDVSVFGGGWTAWTAAGLPEATGSAR